MDDVVAIPGCPLIPSVQLPEMLLSPQSLSYQHLLDTAANIEKSAGIIVNTCLALEQRAVEALNNGLCSLNARTPPVYPLAPLIDVDNDRKEEGVAQHECVRWLDLQPSKSMVFLCFGRRGGFSPKQLREMAVGLENCGYRFLWAVQNPELEALLPEGFLQRTRDRGCYEVLGAADGGAESRLGGRLRHTLRPELDAGSAFVWCAHDWLASVRGAENEPDFYGGRNEGGSAGREDGGGLRDGGGVGEESAGVDGVGEGERDQAPGGGNQILHGGGTEGGWAVGGSFR